MTFKDFVCEWRVCCPVELSERFRCEGGSSTLVKMFTVAFQNGLFQFLSVVDCFYCTFIISLFNECYSRFGWTQNPS